MVAAASFDDETAARQAIEVLASSDVRPEEISVIARNDALAARIAGAAAWYPGKDATGIARLLRKVARRLPRDVRRRYGKELASGKIVIVAAAGGQPSDTLAALLSRAGGRLV